MLKTSELEHAYRFGDNGPKYLLKGPWCDIGVVVLKPGQSFRNHCHNQASEAFLTLEGEACLYINGHPHIQHAGDLLCCEPNEAHYIVNRGKTNWKAVFVKSPHVANDSHPVEPSQYD